MGYQEEQHFERIGKIAFAIIGCTLLGIGAGWSIGLGIFIICLMFI
jgi:hypothetical protein